jgi:malonate-semialdehyde dehydrogenase (acetylating) / methylmalonate-semialdehyde dehydrogenase
MAILPEVKKHYGTLQFLINGQWVNPSSSATEKSINPATGEVIAEFATATEQEANDAVKAAHEAFKKWGTYPLRERAQLLFKMRERFCQKHEELSRVLTQDHGRTIDEARGSVSRVIENMESACAALYSLPKQNEHLYQVADGIDQSLTWEPLGPFLIITPGNIPMHAWSSFVPYALAAGCPVVVSPSRQDPVAAEYISRTSQEVGFPPGVINLIHGGRKINKHILERPEIKGVGFIGSNVAGWELFATCARLGKTSSINGNGKNYLLIMPDADLDQAAQWLLRACFGMAGQRCLGADNVVLMEEIYEPMKKKFIEAAKSMKLGYGLDETVQNGPMATPEGKNKVVNWIERSIKEGAKVALDGRMPKIPDYPKGNFLGPTILENVDPDMTTAKEEAFGPVASLIRGKSLDEVIEWINTKTNLGHSSCIFTASGKVARKFTREVNVGNIGVNVAVAQPYAFFPLGSRRESFVGTAKSRMASMRLFMDEKMTVTRWV